MRELVELDGVLLLELFDLLYEHGSSEASAVVEATDRGAVDDV